MAAVKSVVNDVRLILPTDKFEGFNENRMTTKMQLELEILPQPDQFTCGPTCLQAVYRYFGDAVPLPKVIEEIPQLEDGGTLAVVMACHALARGYKATIYTRNI
jgi:hypothetical protein